MKNVISKFAFFVVMIFSFSVVFAAEIHCNPDTKTCHKSDCRYYNCKGCTKVFASEEEALENGYKFCQICSKEKKESPKKGKKK